MRGEGQQHSASRAPGLDGRVRVHVSSHSVRVYVRAHGERACSPHSSLRKLKRKREAEDGDWIGRHRRRSAPPSVPPH